MTGCGSPRHMSGQVKSVCKAQYHIERLKRLHRVRGLSTAHDTWICDKIVCEYDALFSAQTSQIPRSGRAANCETLILYRAKQHFTESLRIVLLYFYCIFLLSTNPNKKKKKLSMNYSTSSACVAKTYSLLHKAVVVVQNLLKGHLYTIQYTIHVPSLQWT